MIDLSNNQVIHQKKWEIEFLQFRKLLEFEEISHAYTLKHNGMNLSVKTQGEKIAIQNYRRIAEGLEIYDYQLVKPAMEHTANVEAITNTIIEDQFNTHQKTDGVITDRSDILLGTTSADCMTILCYEPVKKVIGSIHSGWRGTFQKILPNAIAQMVKYYQIDPKEVICCICPTIRQCHFEVGEDVEDICKKVITSEADRRKVIYPSKEKKKKWYLDTLAVQKIFLQEIGVLEKNIIDSEICSVETSKYLYSYRADKGLKGLNAGVICKKGGKR